MQPLHVGEVAYMVIQIPYSRCLVGNKDLLQQKMGGGLIVSRLRSSSFLLSGDGGGRFFLSMRKLWLSSQNLD